jgi:hypothetical protein
MRRGLALGLGFAVAVVLNETAPAPVVLEGFLPLLETFAFAFAIIHQDGIHA